MAEHKKDLEMVEEALVDEPASSPLEESTPELSEKPSPEQALDEILEKEKAEEKKPAGKGIPRRTLWILFGIFALIALIVPAALVYLQSLNAPLIDDMVLTPVAPQDGTQSKETTKAAEPNVSVEESDTFGAEYAEWDYQTNGRNIAQPMRGPKIYDTYGQVNPEYYDTYRKATGKDDPCLKGIPYEIKTKSGTVVVEPDPSENPNVSKVRSDLPLFKGTDSSRNNAFFEVDGSVVEVTIGQRVPGTKYTLTFVSRDSVELTDGSEILTYVVTDPAE